MGGKSQNGRRFQVHREFECSRLEQAMLAAAYRRVLPNDRLMIVERKSTTINHCVGQGLHAVHKDENLSHYYASAIGGPS